MVNHECRNLNDKVMVSKLNPNNNEYPFVWGHIDPKYYDQQVK